jgi:cysteinyl-tRNA synthetase
MGSKYLGSPFDIHGGGMDLVFPHHESEIAQCVASTGHAPCRYWMHNNMITINGQKMGKSLGNFITLDEFFSGSHKDKDGKEMLEQPYSPMTIRFFILQAHYRSTVDFSNEALQAAEKGFAKLMEAYKTLDRLTGSANGSSEMQAGRLRTQCYDAMNDDFATPTVISHLFEAAKIINGAADGKVKLTQADIDELKGVFDTFLFDILGMKDETSSDNTALIDGLMHIILDIRAAAKANKDWTTSDKIRDALKEAGVTVKDGKDGATYSY